jgi:hypothetical protein
VARVRPDADQHPARWVRDDRCVAERRARVHADRRRRPDVRRHRRRLRWGDRRRGLRRDRGRHRRAERERRRRCERWRRHGRRWHGSRSERGRGRARDRLRLYDGPPLASVVARARRLTPAPRRVSRPGGTARPSVATRSRPT